MTPAAFAVTEMDANKGARPNPSILVMSQKIKNNEVTVDYVYAPKDAVLAIYAANAQGQTEKTPLGTLTLAPGSHVKVNIKLSKAPAPGSTLRAVLEQAGKSGSAAQNEAFQYDGKAVGDGFNAL